MAVGGRSSPVARGRLRARRTVARSACAARIDRPRQHGTGDRRSTILGGRGRLLGLDPTTFRTGRSHRLAGPRRVSHHFEACGRQAPTYPEPRAACSPQPPALGRCPAPPADRAELSGGHPAGIALPVLGRLSHGSGGLRHHYARGGRRRPRPTREQGDAHHFCGGAEGVDRGVGRNRSRSGSLTNCTTGVDATGRQVNPEHPLLLRACS